MPDVTDGDLERLHAHFQQIETEIREGSITEAVDIARTGQHNVERIIEEVEDVEE